VNIRLKILLIFLTALLAWVGILEILGSAWLPEWLPVSERSIRWTTWALAITGSGLVLWLTLSWVLQRRLRRGAAVSQAWLGGRLLPRIQDGTPDELGKLQRNLDRIVDQLAQDEQDLAELRQREDRLTDQVRALSVVEERNRLARELHDGVKQHLFSLSMTASAIQGRAQSDPACLSQDLAEMIDQIRTTAQTAQREMTRLIEDLRPASIYERGLATALNDYALLFGAREHLLIYFDVQGSDALLAPSVAETLYIIAQEALANVAHHARATRVDMKLHIIPEQVVLSIRDNGAGFDLSQPRQGMGVSNMQERLMGLGGRLTIESQVGRGTSVIAEVGVTRPLPVPNEASHLDQNRPRPTVENWLWLGQRLVIPVGQTWPWLPAEEKALHQNLVELAPDPVRVKEAVWWLGMAHGYTFQQGGFNLGQVKQTRNGYTWQTTQDFWKVRDFHGAWVLYRNGQPLAAVQYQGRQMDAWSEFIYAGHGYRLAEIPRTAGQYSLTDEDGQEMLNFDLVDNFQITVRRPLALNLLILAALRLLHTRIEQ